MTAVEELSSRAILGFASPEAKKPYLARIADQQKGESLRQSILYVGRVKSFSVHYCIARREICIFVGYSASYVCLRASCKAAPYTFARTATRLISPRYQISVVPRPLQRETRTRRTRSAARARLKERKIAAQLTRRSPRARRQKHGVLEARGPARPRRRRERRQQ